MTQGTDLMTLFKIMIIVQLFFSFGITILAYTLPGAAASQLDLYQDTAEGIGVEGITGEIEDSLSRQTNIPVIELGALVFYSGNILIDLLLNFAFAIPQMITILISSILNLINVETQLVYFVQAFLTAAIGAIYLIAITQTLLGVRSGRFV